MHPMHSIQFFVATASLAAFLVSPVEAQIRCLAPSIGNNGVASTSTSYPWNRRSSNIRVQYSYDPSEVPGGGLIVITRIQYRPVDSAATTTTWVGGTYGDVEIKMSNGSTAYDQITSNFANNHGANVATVYSGSVSVIGGSGTGSGIPSNPYVDITLQVPFVYDPTMGPLLVDIASDGSQWVANSGGTPTVLSACTFTNDVKKVYRMFNLSSHTATTGTIQASVGMVMEMQCASAGIAVVGQSCSDGLGNFGEHYSNEHPTVGNANFSLEARTLPPSAAAILAIGLVPNYQSIDLTRAGAPGCFIHTDPLLQIGLQTTTGSANGSDGTLSVAAPIPNSPGLVGFFLQSQVWVADARSLRPLAAVFTNALGITIQ